MTKDKENPMKKETTAEYLKKWLARHEAECPFCMAVRPARCMVGAIAQSQVDSVERTAQQVSAMDQAQPARS